MSSFHTLWNVEVNAFSVRAYVMLDMKVNFTLASNEELSWGTLVIGLIGCLLNKALIWKLMVKGF